MTEKPVKPLSERIREAQMQRIDRVSQSPLADSSATFSLGAVKKAMDWRQAETLGFLAELAEMMEKK